MPETPIEIVQRFISTWHTMDVERFLHFLTDDAVYHNMPIEPCVGTEAISKSFDVWMPAVDEWMSRSTTSSPTASS